ncbi:hypothetical protein BAY61_08140 [Prauserella marina]|nr:hypothetical protein BAY61_08140 [Prauserella marina]
MCGSARESRIRVRECRARPVEICIQAAENRTQAAEICIRVAEFCIQGVEFCVRVASEIANFHQVPRDLRSEQRESHSVPADRRRSRGARCGPVTEGLDARVVARCRFEPSYSAASFARPAASFAPSREPD